MTSTADTEDRIVKACRTIAVMWPAMLPTTPHAGVGHASPKALITQADDSDSTVDLPRIDVLADLRHRVALDLHFYARTLVNERQLSHHLPKRAADAPGMAKLLERHARWWSGHELANDMVTDLEQHAHDCSNATFPRKRERIKIGACTWCGEEVWAKPGTDEVTCRACGCTGGVAEWADAIGDLPLVTLPQLARTLQRRMGMRVTDRTLRRWHTDGILQRHIPFGPQPEHPPRWPVFDQLLAMRAIANLYRACPMCGQPWAGSGWECLRCRAAAPERPTRARRRAPAPARPREQMPVVALTPEMEEQLKTHRCPETGLPLAWCACGWCEAC